MGSSVANAVDAILTAILQWRVSWLDEQKRNAQPPPICRTQPRKLKILYDNYKDYESTFIPLLMHEIWAQIYEEWIKMEYGINEDGYPMDLDEPMPAATTTSNPQSTFNNQFRARSKREPSPRQIWIGVSEYKVEKEFQCALRCQYLIESNRVNEHLKLIGDGDLVRLDLKEMQNTADPTRKDRPPLNLFGYVADVSSERVTQYTTLAECFTTRPSRNYHVINYQVIIARRQLKLDLSYPMKITGLYYLKPMIRQVESVAILRESPLASDILSPKKITCQLSVPTIVSIQSPYYNDMQYKAIIGSNEALVRNIPKIQLIQGPPGTGKTHTLIGIIKHFYTHWQDTSRLPKVLICAPSNGAIDEVTKRLYNERDFLKKAPARRSLRMLRVGHPDHVSESIRIISLDELVDINASNKLTEVKKKHTARMRDLENQLSDCDIEITNLRYSKRDKEIPKVEAKIARLVKELENTKATEEVSARREVSEASKRHLRFELVKNADVILTTLNSCQRHPLDALFKKENADVSFHCVIVDEASQCCEPELLMPLCYKISKMILIGDPMQLPATVISRYAQEFDFGRSLFERFFIHFGKYEPTSPIAMLREQYRMHPAICHFPSKQFYDNRLLSARHITEAYPLKPYIMFDLRHSSEKKSDKTSLENPVEADFIRNLLVAVLNKAPTSSQIGIITPYKGQKRLLTNRINNILMERNIKIDVNTCDGFQGQEKDIIILSCVRAFDSGNSIGFLKSYQRINVALTRAKHCLIVCISAKALTKDKTWGALVDDARERYTLQTLTQTPSSNALIDMISYNIGHDEEKPYFTLNNGPEFITDIDTDFILPMDID